MYGAVTAYRQELAVSHGAGLPAYGDGVVRPSGKHRLVRYAGLFKHYSSFLPY